MNNRFAMSFVFQEHLSYYIFIEYRFAKFGLNAILYLENWSTTSLVEYLF